MVGDDQVATQAGQSRTVHLTPTAPGLASTAEINAQVAAWFKTIQAAAIACTGKAPRVSDPADVSVSAQVAWGRKSWPLFAAFLATWGLFLWRGPKLAGPSPDPFTIVVFVAMLLLLLANLFFSAGFLQANSAIKRGNLDAVTSDDPPDSTATQLNEQPPLPTGRARISWLAVGSAVCSIPSWLLVISSLSKLYDSLGPDGLPPKNFTLGLFELLVLGTGGFVGLAALFLGKEALRQIRSGAGGLLGARLAVIGVIGIPTGLLVKFLPFLLAAGSRSFGWQPSSEQGELFVGAVLVGILLLAAWAAQALRRWAKCGTAPGPAAIPP